METVEFCQAIPNEILRKAVQEEAGKSGLNIRIIEKGGRRIKSMLQRSDVKPEKSCNDPTYVVCLTSSKGQCRKENLGYVISCVYHVKKVGSMQHIMVKRVGVLRYVVVNMPET